MTAGFKSINDDGTVQIDANFKNYVLVDSGVLTLSSFRATLVVVGTAPIVAFNRLRLLIDKVTRSGDTWTFSFFGYTTPALPNPADFNYYVFDVDYDAVSGSECGLLLYDESGDLVFDSNNVGFPNVVGLASRQGDDPLDTITLASGRTIAIVQAQVGYKLVSLGPGIVGARWTAAEAFDNVVKLYPREGSPVGGTNVPYSAYYTSVPSTYLFLDITDLL